MGVPTSLGYAMSLPPMVMRVRLVALPFLGLDFADNLGVRDFLPALNGDFAVLDGEEGVGAFYMLAIVGTNVDTMV